MVCIAAPEGTTVVTTLPAIDPERIGGVITVASISATGSVQIIPAIGDTIAGAASKTITGAYATCRLMAATTALWVVL